MGVDVGGSTMTNLWKVYGNISHPFQEYPKYFLYMTSIRIFWNCVESITHERTFLPEKVYLKAFRVPQKFKMADFWTENDTFETSTCICLNKLMWKGKM